MISATTIKRYAALHPEAAEELMRWNKAASRSIWRDLNDVRRYSPDADQFRSMLIFNIRHNDYRLIVKVDYRAKLLMHERLLIEVEKLMDKGERRTTEEDAALELMVQLIKDYEEEHHALPEPSPREMLAYLMEKRGLKQVDLVPIFNSRGYVSDVINGKRAISKVHAKQLANFFKVSADLFI